MTRHICAAKVYVRWISKIPSACAVSLVVWSRELVGLDVRTITPLIMLKRTLGQYRAGSVASAVHLRYRDDAYDILMLWISSQSFAQNTSSSLVSTDLASSLNRSRNHRSNGGDANKKTLYYTPWNGRFFVQYSPNPSMRAISSGQFNSRFHSFQLRPIMPRIAAQLFGFPLIACSPDIWIPFRAWTRVSLTPA